jgi:hypothetical protein
MASLRLRNLCSGPGRCIFLAGRRLQRTNRDGARAIGGRFDLARRQCAAAAMSYYNSPKLPAQPFQETGGQLLFFEEPSHRDIISLIERNAAFRTSTAL